MNHPQKKIAVLIVGAVLLGVLGYAGLRLTLRSDEFSVSRKIYRGIWAFEKEDIEACMALVSDRYQDEYGRNRQGLRQLLEKYFRTRDEFLIKIKHVSAKADGQEMLARVRVKFFFKKAGGQENYYQQGQLDIRMCREEGWKICAIKYTPAEDVFVYGQIV